MKAYRKFQRELRQLIPRDEPFMVEVPRDQRTNRDHREYLHFTLSEIVYLVSIGNDRLQAYLMDGQQITIPGNLGSAHRRLRKSGFEFIRTHRQVLARLDLISGMDQG